MNKTEKPDPMATLSEFINNHGMPTEIGVRGWITEVQEWNYKDEYIGDSVDGLKGWIKVPRIDSDNNHENYDDLETIFAIVKAMCENNVSGTELTIAINDDTATVNLENEDADGKSWEWNGAAYELDELEELIRRELEIEDEDEEVDINEFLWDHCEAKDFECEYDLSYGGAWVHWDDHTKICFIYDSRSICEVSVKEIVTKENRKSYE